MKIVELEIKDIEIQVLLRVITGTVEEKVKEYAEMMEEGTEFDPILVWERPDGRYWLIDGAHRIEASKRIGKTTIKAKLINCKNELEYRIEAIRANLKHGLPLRKEEKVILAQSLYKSGGVSKEELRKIFGVSEITLWRWLQSVKKEEKKEKIEKAKELREQGWKIEDIAKELGVDERSVYRYLEEGEEPDKNFKMKNLSPSPTPQEEYEEDYYEEEEEEQKREQDWDEILRPYAEAYERVFGKGKEEKTETKAKEEDERKDLKPPEKQLEEWTTQIQYWTLRILSTFGRRKATRVFEELLYDLKTLSNEELWQKWRKAYGLALADKKIKPYNLWED